MEKSEMNEESLRLQVFLSHSGVASRRGAVDIIQSGRVQINGSIVMEPGARVKVGDKVFLDGKQVHTQKKMVYIALHKPSKYLCSNADPQGRPLALSLIEHLIPQRMFHVGRLDYLTSGLIFFTNDGNFSQAVLHPSTKIEKEYEVQTKKPIPDEFLDQFLRGITYQGVTYKASSYVKKGPRRVYIVLTEGKNRELRYAFESHGLYVKKVHRFRIGPVQLGKIPPGQFRQLNPTEVQFFMDLGNKRK